LQGESQDEGQGDLEPNGRSRVRRFDARTSARPDRAEAIYAALAVTLALVVLDDQREKIEAIGLRAPVSVRSHEFETFAAWYGRLV
jgi:hypothetical protein